jgi:heavy metal efflux system protein
MWGVRAEDLLTLVQTAVGGKTCSQITEGEKQFDLTLRFPPRLRGDLEAIKRLPVELLNNTVTPGYMGSLAQTTVSGATVSGVSLLGTSVAFPTLIGTVMHTNIANVTAVPQRRLGDLILPVNERGLPDPKGSFIRPGASTISREQGQRFIAVKFSVKGRDLAGTVADAQELVNPLIEPPYRVEWGGEFQEMEEAEERLLTVVSISLVIIFFLLYMALRSFLDALVVYANVLAMSLGGLWALLLTGTNFNISAAVGFISILGVAVMNGLLLVSSFNALRAHGVELRQALFQGVERLIRPVTMTALAAILGLLPAALSTRIGSQSQRPLAIVVVGGMITTLLLTNLVPLLYSFYGKRVPPADTAGIGH